MSEPTGEQPVVTPEVTTAPVGGRWSRIPHHLGRARTSTVVLGVLFLAIFTLYLNIRPETTGTATDETGTTAPAEAPAPTSESATPTPRPRRRPGRSRRRRRSPRHQRSDRHVRTGGDDGEHRADTRGDDVAAHPDAHLARGLTPLADGTAASAHTGADAVDHLCVSPDRADPTEGGMDVNTRSMTGRAALAWSLV